MKFIDKSLNKAEGNLLVDEFLDSRWCDSTKSYSKIDYSTHPTHPFKLQLRDALRQLLLTEQKKLCCYCMRSIDDNTTTFEHIVPQSTNTEAELSRYTHFPIIGDNVCLQSVFENATEKRNTPPFPLEIAYENLVASCNGRVNDGIPRDKTPKFCNNKRKNNFIEPLFFVSTIENEIRYKKGGLLLFPLKDAYDESISEPNLNLNYDTLKRIRQVWYYIRVENIEDIENANTEAERNEILTVNLMGLPQAKRNQLIADFTTKKFWNILLQYKWFYNYFRNEYPIANR